LIISVTKQRAKNSNIDQCGRTLPTESPFQWNSSLWNWQDRNHQR